MLKAKILIGKPVNGGYPKLMVDEDGNIVNMVGENRGILLYSESNAWTDDVWLEIKKWNEEEMKLFEASLVLGNIKQYEE